MYGLTKQLVKMGVENSLSTMKFPDLKRFEQVNGVYVRRVLCIRTRQSICYTPEMISYVMAALPKALRFAKVGVQALSFLVDGKKRSLFQAALQFVLYYPQISAVITGTKTAQHLEQKIATLEAPPLTEEEFEKIALVS